MPVRHAILSVSAGVAIGFVTFGAVAVASIDPPSTPMELIDVLKSVGFPAAIAIFILARIEPALRDLTRVITRIETILEDRGRRDP